MKNATVLDPFCGSGTVLLESVLSGQNAIGADVNPLARLISQVKVNPLDPEHVERHLPGIVRRARTNTTPHIREDLRYWFKPGVIRTLALLRDSIFRIRHAACRDFYLVTLSSIVRSVSWADPSIAPPVKLSAERLHRANERYRRDLVKAQNVRAQDVYDSFTEAVSQNLHRLAELSNAPGRGNAIVLPEGVEAACTGLPAGSVDLVLTSPPYCGAQKYVRSLRLEMLLLGEDLASIADADRKTLGSERISIRNAHSRLHTLCAEADRLILSISIKNITRAVMLAEYIRYLQRFAFECRRVLRPGGVAFVTFGTSTIAGCTVDFAQLFASISVAAGLQHIATLIDRIPSRGLLTRRHNSAGTIDDEQVVWLKR